MSATIIEHPAASAQQAAEALAAATTEIALVDFSSIAFPVWHMSGNEPDPNHASRHIVARVRSLLRPYKWAAICCDSGKSFRAELSADYKAQREKQPETFYRQLRLAQKTLEADGFPVWSVKGFEADDLIATAARRAVEAGLSVLVVSSDKDLLQLVGPRVRAFSPSAKENGHFDVAAVVAKFGVRPEQLRDYLTLVGDSADNVKGARGIGEKKAADLLKRWQTLEGVYEALDTRGTQFTPSTATALREFQANLQTARALITLRDDVEIPFDQLFAERKPKPVAPIDEVDMSTGELIEAEAVQAAPEPENTEAAPVIETTAAPVDPAKPAAKPAAKDPIDALASNGGVPVPVGPFEKQLEPQSLTQAAQLAKAMYLSGLFGAGYGNQHAVLSTIIAGRELGMQAMASLRAFHIVEGKHRLAADTLRALVLRSGLAKYFRCTERTAERCTFETWRKDDPESIRLTFTIEQAQRAGLVKPKSGWEKFPEAMLTARATAELARLVYPEVGFGIYDPSELEG